MSAVTTRRPFESWCRSNTLMPRPSPSARPLLSPGSPRLRRGDGWGTPSGFPLPLPRRISCGQPLTPLVGDRHGLALLVVVADHHALGLRHHLAVDAEHVLEVEALDAEAARAHRNLDLAAETDGGAEVDLDAGDDDGHVLEAPGCAGVEQVRNTSRLNVGQKHRIVNVAERIEVTEADALAMDELGCRHAGDAIDAADLSDARCSADGRGGDAKGDLGAAGVAAQGADRPAPARGTGALHRLRHVLPRGADGRRGPAGSGARSRSGAGGRRARRGQPRR